MECENYAKTFWPPFSGIKLTNAIASCLLPEETWNLHPIRILAGGKQYDDYNKAKLASLRAQSTSDLHTGDETLLKKSRHIRQKRIIESDDEVANSVSEDDKMPLMPPLQKRRNLQTPIKPCNSSYQESTQQRRLNTPTGSRLLESDKESVCSGTSTSTQIPD
ncbi:hypothetical protein FQR65_LT17309 [Abscondita terminalis]|nr:hypothetical protein FQR65_LT17309 [Abscondita terminalis]